MPISKRPAKRIASVTLNNMKKRTAETAVIKDLKKLVKSLGKPDPKLQEKIEQSQREINRVPRNGLKLRK